jgi:hypothetical protein
MADQVSVCWNWMSSGLPCVFAYKYSWPYILNASCGQFSWSQTCHSVFTPITVFWNVEPCCLVGNYRRFEGNRFSCHEDRGSMFLRNGGYLSDCTASYLSNDISNVIPLFLLVTESTVRCEPISIHIHDLVFAPRDEIAFAL